VPESDATLEAASCVGGKLFLRRLRDARHEVVTADPKTGKETAPVRLPSEIGSVGGFAGKRDAATTFFRFANQSPHQRFGNTTRPRGRRSRGARRRRASSRPTSKRGRSS
jgi:prolyl oligopeptidase PreP (S9A serine peptidase family)